MKIGGIILIVIGALGLFSSVAEISVTGRGGEGIGFGIGFVVLGAFLIDRAKRKSDKENAKEKWKNR